MNYSFAVAFSTICPVISKMSEPIPSIVLTAFAVLIIVSLTQLTLLDLEAPEPEERELEGKQ